MGASGAGAAAAAAAPPLLAALLAAAAASRSGWLSSLSMPDDEDGATDTCTGRRAHTAAWHAQSGLGVVGTPSSRWGGRARAWGGKRLGLGFPAFHLGIIALGVAWRRRAPDEQQARRRRPDEPAGQWGRKARVRRRCAVLVRGSHRRRHTGQPIAAATIWAQSCLCALSPPCPYLARGVTGDGLAMRVGCARCACRLDRNPEPAIMMGAPPQRLHRRWEEAKRQGGERCLPQGTRIDDLGEVGLRGCGSGRCVRARGRAVQALAVALMLLRGERERQGGQRRKPGSTAAPTTHVFFPTILLRAFLPALPLPLRPAPRMG